MVVVLEMATPFCSELEIPEWATSELEYRVAVKQLDPTLHKEPLSG